MSKPQQKNQKQSRALGISTPPAAKNWKVLGFIFACSFLLYYNTFDHGYALDDDIYTLKNRFIQQGFSAVKDIFNKGSLVGFNNANESNYRPIVLLNFMIDTAIWGNNPGREHKVNVFLYALTGVFLYLLLLKVFKRYNYWIPLLITLLFIFHPTHTEVVASIKSRDELLAWLFGIISFYYIMLYSENLNKAKNLYLCMLFYFLSALCKENSLTFIIIYPLMLYTFTDVPLKKILTAILPFFAGIVVLYMIIRTRTLDNITFDKMIVMNNALMACKTPTDMLATNFAILGKYLWLLLVPTDLTWDYTFNQVGLYKWSDWKPLLAFALHLGMGAYVAMKIKEKDVFVFAILFYLITLFLSSNLIVKIGATMAERFLYVPSLGFSIVIVIGLCKLLKINPAAVDLGPQKNTMTGILGVILLLYGIKTHDRNPAWKNNFELFSTGLTTSPNSLRVHFAMASEYRVKGEKEQDQNKKMEFFTMSLKQYDEGLKLAEVMPEVTNDAELWYNIGLVYYYMGNNDSALVKYTKSLSYNPNYVNSLNNTGVIYFNKKDYTKALEYFKKIIVIDPNFSDAQTNAGAAYHNMNDFNTAITYYEAAYKLNPYNVNTLKNMITVYQKLGDAEKVNFYSQEVDRITGGK